MIVNRENLIRVGLVIAGALAAYALMLLGCQRIPTAPREPHVSFSGQWFAPPDTRLTIEADGKRATLRQEDESASAEIKMWIHPGTGDSLLQMRFSDSLTTINVWIQGDSLHGDEIKPEGWRWVTFYRSEE